jgi:hypothetical protein
MFSFEIPCFFIYLVNLSIIIAANDKPLRSNGKNCVVLVAPAILALFGSTYTISFDFR